MRPRLGSSRILCCNRRKHQNHLHALRRTHVCVFFESALCHHDLLKAPEPQECDHCWKTRQEQWQWTALLQEENVDLWEILAGTSGTNEINMQWKLRRNSIPHIDNWASSDHNEMVKGSVNDDCRWPYLSGHVIFGQKRNDKRMNLSRCESVGRQNMTGWVCARQSKVRIHTTMGAKVKRSRVWICHRVETAACRYESFGK